MSFQLALDKKKLWILTIAMVLLTALIFFAGMLTGILLNVPSQPHQQIAKSNLKNPQTLIRKKINAPIKSTEKKVNKALAPIGAPVKVKLPQVKVPKLPPPVAGAAKQAKQANRAIKKVNKSVSGKKPSGSSQAAAVAAGPSAADTTAQDGGSNTDESQEQKSASATVDSSEPTDGTASDASNSSEPTDEADKSANIAPAATASDEKSEQSGAETSEADAIAFEPEFPYSLRLASFQTVKRAETAFDEYMAMGIEPHIVHVNLGKKGIWWRLYYGHYRNQAEAMADRDKKQLKDTQIIRTRWATLIGVFNDETSVATRFDQLKAKGWYPYIIESGEGQYRLFVGAFLSRKGAEAQQEALSQKGIESRTVLR